ncbi:proteasome inhibitor PI31 subunit [Drosophila madeirensis]|uniref:Proteasome inhibitor PI31 subunit n=1 Tax=Drosophila madeirensis TaxID=30013 RepID=A0AAU9G3U9_DROMD
MMEAHQTSTFVSMRSVKTMPKFEFELESESGPSDLDADQFYGWQLLFYSIRRSLRKKADLLLALAHFLMTKQYHLRSVDPERGRTPTRMCGSELLPKHWNRDAPNYRLHYVDELERQYVLLARLTHQDLVLNLQNWTSKRMSITCLQPEHLVQCLRGPTLGQCIPNAQQVMHHLRVYLVNPVVRGQRVAQHQCRPSASGSSMDMRSVE